jgi:integral membrane protein
LAPGRRAVDDLGAPGPPKEAVVTSIRLFKMIALAEAASYLLLLGASVAKRALDAPELVTVMGPIHGVLFLTYVALALYVREQLRWTGWTTVMVVVAAVVPLGGLIVERRIPDEAATPVTAAREEARAPARR